MSEVHPFRFRLITVDRVYRFATDTSGRQHHSSRDTVCPLCQGDEETVLHLLGECSALVVKRANILCSPYLCYEELGKMHWCALLRLAKAS